MKNIKFSGKNKTTYHSLNDFLLLDYDEKSNFLKFLTKCGGTEAGFVRNIDFKKFELFLIGDETSIFPIEIFESQEELANE